MADFSRFFFLSRFSVPLLLTPQILEDYFTLSLDEFSQRCGEIRENPPIVEKILENLNPTQKRIVTDDQSRALLVLAGPGSGKTVI